MEQKIFTLALKIAASESIHQLSPTPTPSFADCCNFSHQKQLQLFWGVHKSLDFFFRNFRSKADTKW